MLSLDDVMFAVFPLDLLALTKCLTCGPKGFIVPGQCDKDSAHAVAPSFCGYSPSADRPLAKHHVAEPRVDLATADRHFCLDISHKFLSLMLLPLHRVVFCRSDARSSGAERGACHFCEASPRFHVTSPKLLWGNQSCRMSDTKHILAVLVAEVETCANSAEVHTVSETLL